MMTGLEKWKFGLSLTQIQNTGDTGLRPSGNLNEPKKETPHNMVGMSCPSGIVPSWISRLNSFASSMYQFCGVGSNLILSMSEGIFIGKCCNGTAESCTELCEDKF